MNCCVNCFFDIEIRNIIRSRNQIGDCNFCECTNVNVYDIDDKDRLLSELLYELLSIYANTGSLPPGFPREKIDFLKNILHKEWMIFTGDPERIHLLIRAICKDKYDDDFKLFDLPVGLPQNCDADYLDANSLLKGNSWDSFVASIKTENRFHSNQINTNILGLFVDYAKSSFRAGKQFYRARISSSPVGYALDDMGPPPSKDAKAGRVNSEGISILYLADSIDTVVYEVRAGRFDYITIGTFELQEDITIVSLDSLKTISPFMRGGGMAQHAVNLAHLSRLSQEVARPLRRYDSPLDYLPTQYLSDFIKSQPGISGITYGSAMAQKGLNLAAFDPSIFKCTGVEVLEITGLQYHWEPIR